MAFKISGFQYMIDANMKNRVGSIRTTNGNYCIVNGDNT